MKKLITLVSFALMLGAVLVISCKPYRNDKEEKEKAAITDTINRLMAEIIKYSEQLNADSTFKYLTTDSASIYMSGGMYYSYASLNAAFKNVFNGFKSQQNVIIFSEVKVPEKDLAIWIGYLKNNAITKTDQVIGQYLCETWIWQRKPEGWRVIHYHESMMNIPSAEQRSLVEIALGKLAGDLAMKSLKPEDMRPILTDFLKKYPSVYGTTLAFAPTDVDGKSHKAAPYFYRSGNEFKETELPEAYDYTVSEWYAVPVKTKAPCWSNPYYDAGGGGVVMITYSIPLYDKDNKLTGVLTSDLELK
ncbi:MAG: nuclear transport factor 2 family protein [Bacteroidales bacterium]|jgi:hypothetical protein|nr:nuclear transport factor 2 family protein [Bacteroidales bacterium]